MATLGNPQETIAVLQKYGFNFQKRFGQNFLIDPRVLEKIMAAAEIGPEDCVLEIGPGIGTMTQYLAERAARVVAVEIDGELIPILQETLADYGNVTLIQEDILKVDIKELAREYGRGRPFKVVANLPYYITTPIVMGLLEGEAPVASITVMVQKEVADRMQAGPGIKGLRSALAGSAVLRESLYCGECASQLLYSQTECGVCGDPPYPARNASVSVGDPPLMFGLSGRPSIRGERRW